MEKTNKTAEKAMKETKKTKKEQAKNGKISDEIIKAYSLKNAVEHDGKAIVGSVISGLFAAGLKKEEIKDIIMRVNLIVNDVNKMPLETQKQELAEFEKKGLISKRETRAQDELPELESAEEGKVVTRFAPSPSGPLHIGHAATGMPSSLYAKKYKGKFYIRIEDTNPENIDPEAYKMIPEEADWLFGNVTAVIIQSDRMAKYYEFAEKLIKKNAAYVCTCDPEEFKKLLLESKPCPCRSISSKENLERWKRMLSKGSDAYKEGEAVLRFKSNLNDPNPALRDFPLARINETEHPRQGKKYRVWPLMNLCVTLDDIEFKSTHVIRAKDHMDNAKRQEMMLKVFKLKPPRSYFLGRYKFKDLEISCTKTKAKIKAGEFTGWDDIRLPFIAALRKRGFQPEAFAKIAIQRGLSEVDKVISKEDYFEVLSNFNREIIQKIAIKADFQEIPKQKIKQEKPNIEILMPDATVVYGTSKDSNIKKLKEGEIVYFAGFGYATYNPKEKVKFWFCHK